MGVATCALFLSVRYHNLHPDYIHERLKELKRSYSLRVLLVQVSVKYMSRKFELQNGIVIIARRV